MKVVSLIVVVMSLFLSSCKDEVTIPEGDGAVERGVVDVRPEPSPNPPSDPQDPEPTDPENPPPKDSVNVEQVYSLNEDGELNGGEVVLIAVKFSAEVVVTGSPYINLNVNRDENKATYVKGSSSDTLVFQFTVPAKSNETDLGYQDEKSLVVSDGAISSMTKEQVSLVLPVPGSENSLSGTSNIHFSLSDSFNNSEISSQWTLLDEDYWDADQNGISNDDHDVSFRESNGTLMFMGRGRDVWKNRHQFLSAYLEDIFDNFEYSVKVVTRSKSHRWSKTGFLVGNNIGDLHEGGVYSCFVTQSKGIVVQYSSKNSGYINKSKKEGPKTTQEVWLKVKRSGNDLFCYYKYAENDEWTKHSASPTSIETLDIVADVGLFSTAHSWWRSMQVTFDDFQDHMH
jgi:hypothetical protein